METAHATVRALSVNKDVKHLFGPKSLKNEACDHTPFLRLPLVGSILASSHTLLLAKMELLADLPDNVFIVSRIS